MDTIKDIIEEAGGVKTIASHFPKKINKTTGEPVGRAAAVYKWEKLGIPERHWPLLMKLSDRITLDRLFMANRIARGETKPGKGKARSQRAAA